MSHLYFLTRCSKTVHACLLSKCLYRGEVLSCPLSLEARYTQTLSPTLSLLDKIYFFFTFAHLPTQTAPLMTRYVCNVHEETVDEER